VHPTDQGIIVRTHLLTETSLIVRWLSRDHGLISTIAKGARKPKSTFSGKLDLFFQAEFSFQPSRRSDLHVLREVKMLQTHAHLRTDLEALRRAVYASSLIGRFAEPEFPIPALYDLLLEFIGGHLGPVQQPWPLLIFETRVLQDQGLSPDPTRTRLTPGAAKLLGGIQSLGSTAATRLTPSNAQLNEIAALLASILRSHLGSIPKGGIAS